MVIRMVIRMVSRMVIRMVSRMVILYGYGVLEGPQLVLHRPSLLPGKHVATHDRGRRVDDRPCASVGYVPHEPDLE